MSRVRSGPSRVPYTVWFSSWLALLHTVIILFVLFKLTPNHNNHTNKTCIELVVPAPVPAPELVAPAPETEKEDPAMVIKIGAWGRDRGRPWRFLPADGGINKIIVHSEYWTLNSLSFVGRSRTGELEVSGEFGCDRWSTKHEVILEWPEEYLTAISGTIDDSLPGIETVRSIEFRTNQGRKHGPFGRAKGNRFNISLDGSAIVGFHGRAGLYVNAIGVYITPVSSIVK